MNMTESDSISTHISNKKSEFIADVPLMNVISALERFFFFKILTLLFSPFHRK